MTKVYCYEKCETGMCFDHHAKWNTYKVIITLQIFVCPEKSTSKVTKLNSIHI
jgi:hypothetical protein